MPHVLVVAETRAGTLRDVSLELVTAGRELVASSGGRLTVSVVGHDPTTHLDALRAPGVDRIVAVATGVEHSDSHVAVLALRGLLEAERPDVVLLAHSVDSMSFAPAVAATSEAGFVSDAIALSWEDGLVVRRGSYGDKLVAELDFPGKQTVVVMVRPGTFEASPGTGGAPEVTELEVAAEPRSRHVAFREPEVAGVDITAAPFLLSIGRGVEDENEVARFEALAEAMGATLSVSRPLVDAGWVPSARQVGQSGKTVKPKLYLALGISGAVQHLAGMREAQTIVAINKDPNAPIFGVAHYGAVVDLFDVADELERRFGA